jgi:hypothetical protein
LTRNAKHGRKHDRKHVWKPWVALLLIPRVHANAFPAEKTATPNIDKLAAAGLRFIAAEHPELVKRLTREFKDAQKKLKNWQKY